MFVGDSVNDLIAFKKSEDPIVKEYGVVKEPIKRNDEEERKSIIENGAAVLAESS